MPGCEAAIVHTPTPVVWTIARRIVHVPFAANETGNPEVAVALTLKSGSAAVFSRRAAKRIVWSASLGHPACRSPSAEQAAPEDGLRGSLVA